MCRPQHHLFTDLNCMFWTQWIVVGSYPMEVEQRIWLWYVWSPVYLLFLIIPCATQLRRRQWHPTPVFLLRKSHGWRSLVGCSPWGHEESDTTERLHFHFHFHALEKEMATHSSVLAWRIPGTGEPGGLPSMGSHRAGYDWSDLAAAAFNPLNGSKHYFKYWGYHGVKKYAVSSCSQSLWIIGNQNYKWQL